MVYIFNVRRVIVPHVVPKGPVCDFTLILFSKEH